MSLAVKIQNPAYSGASSELKAKSNALNKFGSSVKNGTFGLWARRAARLLHPAISSGGVWYKN